MSFLPTFFVPALASAVIVFRAWRKRSLTPAGCLCAFIVGYVTAYTGLLHFTVLLTFFATGTYLSRFGAKRKARIERDYAPTGNRTAFQVLANGGGATLLLSMMHLGWLADTRAVHLAFLAHYACCLGDTWSSEIGVLSPSDPRLILGFRRVPRGTNGGVTALGTAAAIAGGALLSSAVVLVDALRPLLLLPPLWAATWCTGASLLGTTVDSILGQLFQASYVDVNTGRITSTIPAADEVEEGVKKTSRWQHITGIAVLSNNAVNAVSAAVVSALAFGLAHLLQNSTL